MRGEERSEREERGGGRVRREVREEGRGERGEGEELEREERGEDKKGRVKKEG